MEEKKKIKVSLGTVICIFIIIILIIALVVLYLRNIELKKDQESKQIFNSNSKENVANTSIIANNKENTTSDVNNIQNGIAKNTSYETITKEFDGIDCLYVTEVEKEGNKYTLKGLVYTQYTISQAELNSALDKRRI